MLAANVLQLPSSPLRRRRVKASRGVSGIRACSVNIVVFGSGRGMKSGGWALGRDNGTNEIFFIPIQVMISSFTDRFLGRSLNYSEVPDL